MSGIVIFRITAWEEQCDLVRNKARVETAWGKQSESGDRLGKKKNKGGDHLGRTKRE
jgi:hypothetical protein